MGRSYKRITLLWSTLLTSANDSPPPWRSTRARLARSVLRRTMNAPCAIARHDETTSAGRIRTRRTSRRNSTRRAPPARNCRPALRADRVSRTAPHPLGGADVREGLGGPGRMLSWAPGTYGVKTAGRPGRRRLVIAQRRGDARSYRLLGSPSIWTDMATTSTGASRVSRRRRRRSTNSLPLRSPTPQPPPKDHGRPRERGELGGHRDRARHARRAAICQCQRYKLRPKRGVRHPSRRGTAPSGCAQQTDCGHPERTRRAASSPTSTASRSAGARSSRARPTRACCASTASPGMADRGQDRRQRLGGDLLLHPRGLPPPRHQPRPRPRRRRLRPGARRPGARGLSDDHRAGQEITWGELHVGSRSMFAAAGFTEVSQPTQRRVVMRIDL